MTSELRVLRAYDEWLKAMDLLRVKDPDENERIKDEASAAARLEAVKTIQVLIDWRDDETVPEDVRSWAENKLAELGHPALGRKRHG